MATNELIKLYRKHLKILRRRILICHDEVLDSILESFEHQNIEYEWEDLGDNYFKITYWV